MYINNKSAEILLYIQNIETKGFFQFEIVINVQRFNSIFNALIKYLCQRSTAIIDIFTLSVQGSTLDVRI